LKKELIKTSIEELDDDFDKYLFIADWCLKSKTINSENLEVIEYPFKANQIKEIYEEINNVTESLLVDLTNTYNRHFEINENKKYYKIIIGRWLFHFVSNVFEKIILVNNAIDLYPNISTKTSDFNYELSSDSNSYYQKSYSDDLFNQKLFSSIINLKNNINKTNVDLSKEKKGKKFKTSFFAKIKKSIKPLLGRILVKINKILFDDFILVVDPYYTRKYIFNSIWFFLKSKGKIIHYEFTKNESNNDLDYSTRKELGSFNYENSSELLNISSIILFKFIPTCYLESFYDLREKSKEWHSKHQKCKGFFTANSIHTNEFFKYIVAFNPNNSLSIVQHGNGYGTFRLISAEEYERSVADKYYTWGWGDLKLPHPKLSLNKETNYKSRSRIVFTFPSVTNYSGLLETIHLYFIEKQNIIEDSNKVLKGLLPEIKESLVKRELKQDNLITMQLNYRLKEDKIKDFHISLYKSKIHLTNHFGTPFLESISMNIPTVLFLSNFKDYLRDEVIDIFLELKDANIIFDNPKLASTHINKYYDSIDDWWLKDSTQQIITKFKSKFCISDSNWKNIWLKELITKNK
jgi:putative transferase (TIGR04331 family)